MPENTQNTTEASAVEKKPQFVPVHKFNFKGVSGKSIPIFTAQIEKGKTAGDEYLAPALDKIDWDLIPEVWPTDDVLEEIIRPSLRKLSLAASKIAVEKATINGQLNEALMQEEFCKLLAKLSVSSESRRALAQQRNELLVQLGQLSTQLPDKQQEFIECATAIAAIERQLAALKAQDETVVQPQADQPESAAA